jgi:hypothetical protein
MSDEQPIVVLSIAFEDTQEVVGVFGPYESESEAGKHVGFFRDPEMLGRMKRVQGIRISQFPLEDPSAFTERVEELLDD